MKHGKFEQPRGGSRTAAPKKKSKKKKSAIGPILVVVLLIVLTVGAAGLWFWGSSLQDTDTIFPHVYLAGVDVGGMTADDALTAVDAAITQTYAAETLEVNLPDRKLTFDPTQTNVALDSEQAVAKAMEYGRDCNPFSAVLAYHSSGDRVDIDLTTTMNLDTAYIRGLIDAVAADIAREEVPSTVDFDREKKTLTIVKGIPSLKLNADRLYDAVCEAYNNGTMAPMDWDYESEPLAQLDLQGFYDSFGADPVDAYYDPDAHAIVEAVPGFTFDVQDAEKKLAAAAEGQTVVIRFEDVPAAVSAEDVKAQMFGDKLDSRSSYYWKWQTNRTINLDIACQGINGTIINPGEVFSFNEILGERTAEKGYMPATVFGGEGNMAEGGGICQVASTIFYSSLYLNLEIVQRVPHSYTVDYVPLGMDAAIYWDEGQDYKFRNNRQHPLMIEANIENEHVNITFWGVKENDNYVIMTFEELESWEDPDEELVNEDKPAGYRELIQQPYKGRKVNAYQSIFDGSGKLIDTKHYYSYYYSRPRIYEVSPDMATGSLPPTDPTDPTDPVDPGVPDDRDDPLFGG